MILREQVQPKTVRDPIIIPTVVLPGIQYGRRALVPRSDEGDEQEFST